MSEIQIDAASFYGKISKIMAAWQQVTNIN